MKIYLIVLSILLTACGSGGGGAASNTPVGQPSYANAVAAAEAAGVIPILDRSTSLLGTDADGNGVRDDIDVYINSLPDTPSQKMALRKASSAMSAAMTVDVTNQAAVQALDSKLSASISCLFDVYSSDVASRMSSELEKYTVNTKERFDAYLKYNQITGVVISLPVKGTACAQ